MANQLPELSELSQGEALTDKMCHPVHILKIIGPTLSIQDIAIPEVGYNQTVYVFRCERSTVRVTGKCKSIVLDGCEKTAVVFDDVATTCEFVNCRSVQMQVGDCDMCKSTVD